MAQYKSRTEFTTALTQVAAERGVTPEVILETIKAAILAAYRRDVKERGLAVGEEDQFEVEVNSDTGEAKVFKILEDKENKREDVTPPGFSRIAAQTAKQVILQKIREAEKSAILEEYSKRIGTLVSGLILRFDGSNLIVDIGKAEAVMSPPHQVRSENYRPNQRLTFYLEGVEEGPRGPQMVVSRASENLVKKLFEREVPEVAAKTVEIVGIAREPGVRTKIAVSSNRSGIDPVGSCVGQKGVRVKEVIDELFGEKIDIVQFNPESAKSVAAALSPAEGLSVEIDEKKKTARVVVPEDQLSLAIGRDGQNVRLAAKLTGYKIDIVSATPARRTTKKKEKKEGKSAKSTKQGADFAKSSG